SPRRRSPRRWACAAAPSRRRSPTRTARSRVSSTTTPSTWRVPMDELRRRATQLLDRPPVAPTPIADLPRRARRRRRTRYALEVGAIIVAIVVAAGAVLSLREHDHRRVSVIEPDVTLPVGQSPTFVTSGGGAIWVLTTTVEANTHPGDAGTLVRVDPV